MIRERFHMFVPDLAGWNTVVEAFNEGNKLAETKGWPKAELWTLVSGQVNEVIAEFDYPDLNTYQRVMVESQADPESMAIYKPAMDAMVTERTWNELLMPADPATS